MHRSTWWHTLVALLALHAFYCAAYPTLCQEDGCTCDSFTRVFCQCTASNPEIVLRPNGSYSIPEMASEIVVKDCERVHVLQRALKNTASLYAVQLYDIQHVLLDPRSLEWIPQRPSNARADPKIKIMITNSTIDDISSHAIQGAIGEIEIKNCRIKHIRPFAFSTFSSVVKSIDLSSNIYDNVETQAFKKFTVVNFKIYGGQFQTLPSRFLSDVEILGIFKMVGVTIDHIYSLSFLITGPKRILLENSVIGTLEGDGYHGAIKGSVLFRNNTFETVKKGAFLGFSSDNALVSPEELWLENCTATNITPESLAYNHSVLSLRLDGLHLDKSCSCELSKEWEKLTQDEGRHITCWYELEARRPTLSAYEELRCGDFKSYFWIYVVIGLIVTVMVAAVLVVIIIKRESDKKNKVRIVLPDGKTYRETEFHIVLERAELLTTDL